MWRVRRGRGSWCGELGGGGEARLYRVRRGSGVGDVVWRVGRGWGS